METRRDVAWDAVVHALKLVGVLRRGGRLEKGHRGIDGSIEGTIVMVGYARGVGQPGIHVVWSDQPICERKRLANHQRTRCGDPPSAHQTPAEAW